MRALTLYGRPGCHLCEAAAAELKRLQIPYVEVDIERDDALLSAYLERIPVGVLDGEELFALFVDEGAVRARLQ